MGYQWSSLDVPDAVEQLKLSKILIAERTHLISESVSVCLVLGSSSEIPILNRAAHIATRTAWRKVLFTALSGLVRKIVSAAASSSASTGSLFPFLEVVIQVSLLDERGRGQPSSERYPGIKLIRARYAV